MNAKLINSINHIKTPWKNGQGTTTQIAIYPETANLASQNFDWRISSACISQDSDFSLFQNHHRLLSVIAGNGLRLSLNSSTQSEKLLTAFQVFEFSGATNIQAKILSPNVIDMGVIYDPNKVSASMIFQKAKQTAERIMTQSHINFIICAQGRLRINDFNLLPLDCLRIEGSQTIEIRSDDFNSHFGIISINEL